MTDNIYQQISERTAGDIYLGVVGPVRTGKSTFVKRVMETLVIPNIENIYQRERARDELPQSGSGRTIMTSEPKFVPEDAIEISPDNTSKFSIRLIDSVGYMIPGALGAEENGSPRMVTTPWLPEEIPLAQAAEIGTKKIMEEHCTIGIVITTDGTVHDIPRSDYEQAEKDSIRDMLSTGKPFCVVINSIHPDGELAQTQKAQLESEFGVNCVVANCLTMNEETVKNILSEVLREFPVSEIRFYLPQWIGALTDDHHTKKEIFDKILEGAKDTRTMRDVSKLLEFISTLSSVTSFNIGTIDAGKGIVHVNLLVNEALFYDTLSEYSGFSIKNDRELMLLLEELSSVKRSHDKIAAALDQVQATGYGIVMPTPDEMHLEIPQIVRKGSNYGVRLKASAPSIHMMRADIQTEISPIVGDEKQSEELLKYLQQEYEGDTQKLWDSNIFGKSVYELVSEGLGSKLTRIPEEARCKLQSTLSRIINEGSSGLVCIILD